uniref:FecR family protein n=1 Tax=uncultured Draconibacterium sp. TaxID=1573823 RepID=UPI0032162EEE
MNKNIDFKIIWKKIQGTLTSKEEKVFSEWLNEDKSHHVFFEKVQVFYEIGRLKNEKDIDVLKAWDLVSKRLKQNKQTVWPTWFKIAGSVAATVLIMLSVYMVFYSAPEPEHLSEVQEMIIPPGTSKARLIFDDGESVDLSEGRNFHGEVDGAKVSNQGNQITYNKNAVPVEEIRYNTLEIPRGAEYFVILSDGTRVWLNSDSRLRYPVSFTGDKRVVELEGEAYFEVSENKEVPFQVLSAGQTIEVLGTEFNISSYQDQQLIYTTLVEGKVNVFSDKKPELVKTLVPGYQTYMYKESGDISIREVEINEFVAWKDGYFSFNNKTLEEMMNILSRWYDIDVEFENDTKKKLKFTGEIARYENLEKMLQLIEKTQEVRFEKKENKIRIK